MTDENQFAILQLNLTGISVAKQTLLNKFFNDLKPDFVSLNETNCALPHGYFNNYRTFSQHKTQKVTESLSPYQLKSAVVSFVHFKGQPLTHCGALCTYKTFVNCL